MKFLHISDLHIGKSVNGFSMLGEQKHAFAQILDYIRAERPEAVVIAGDIYDRAVPGTEAVRVFDDFLTALAGEGTAVMIIAGNHDSPERLSYASRLLEDKCLFICGAFEGSVHWVDVSDEHGGIKFWLLPFIRPSALRGLSGGAETETYADALRAALGTADIDYSARNVLVSHQFFAGAGVEPVLSESEINPVGGLDAIDIGLIGGFDYAALGHLHGAQKIGAEHIRYAGSPVKYSFSEWRQEKSVTLVALGEKGSVSVRLLPLVPLRGMREIRGPIDKLLSDEISSLGNREDYLRVILTDEEEIIDPMGRLRSVYPNIMSLSFENSRTKVDTACITAGAESVEALSAYELFGQFFLEAQGSVMNERQAEIVRELMETEGIA